MANDREIIQSLIGKSDYEYTNVDVMNRFIQKLRKAFHVNGLLNIEAVLNRNFRQSDTYLTGCQIHLYKNHYVVSHKLYNNIYIYNSNKNRINSQQEFKNQLSFTYSTDLKSLKLREYVICDQLETNLCGPISAATAFYVCKNMFSPILKLPLNLKLLLNKFNKIVIDDNELIDFDLTGEIEFQKVTLTPSSSFDVKHHPTNQNKTQDHLCGGGGGRNSSKNDFKKESSNSCEETRRDDEEMEPMKNDEETSYGLLLKKYPIIIQDNNIAIKRVIHALSEFMHFTVYEQIRHRIKHKFSTVLELNNPINYSSNVIPSTFTRSRHNRCKSYNNSIPEFSNPAILSSTDENSGVIERAIETKRFLEKEMLLRRGISKAAGNFEKNVSNKIFFNPSIKQYVNLEWKTKQAKLSESIWDDNLQRNKIVIYGANLLLHENRLDHIFSSCFDGLVKKLGNTHSYLINMIKKINRLASTVNFISKGVYSPLALVFKCFRRYDNKLKYFHDFRKYLLEKNYSSTNLNVVLEQDFTSEFDVNELFFFFNPDGALNYDNPMNALVIKDIAHDILPVMLSEILLLTFLFMLGENNNTLNNKISACFKQSYENAEYGVFTVLQCFPGLFTLLCFWAKIHAKHDLKFVRLLDAIISGKQIEKERYRAHMKIVSNDLSQICLDIMDSIVSFNLTNEFKKPNTRNIYSRLYLKNYVNYLNSTDCSFLCTNSFL